MPENQMNDYVLNMRYFAATKLIPEIQKKLSRKHSKLLKRIAIQKIF